MRPWSRGSWSLQTEGWTLKRPVTLSATISSRSPRWKHFGKFTSRMAMQLQHQAVQRYLVNIGSAKAYYAERAKFLQIRAATVSEGAQGFFCQENCANQGFHDYPSCIDFRIPGARLIVEPAVVGQAGLSVGVGVMNEVHRRVGNHQHCFVHFSKYYCSVIMQGKCGTYAGTCLWASC